MNEVQLAEARGRLEAKVDSILNQLDDLNKTLHERINNTNDEVEEHGKALAEIQGVMKTVWGVLALLGTLFSGLALKVFFG